ncbi:FecR domain-containing protein [Spirosoma sp. BT702]|uniref:FecR domain-containing protein n=1 Tax=Spirosoma profusum TaxID=2771354 RepID=A0A926XUJ4_9BACT|nr:FecR family protein [Spirosoma profusum]MBD2700507.1 FecR domain-containing protein [Spirosoma profusum]
MKQYKDYEVNDFLIDDDFVQWVRAGAAPNVAVWRDLLTTYPDKKADLEEARTFILQTLAGGTLSDAELTQEINRILASTAPDVPIRQLGNRFQWWQAAAAVVVLLGIGWGIWQTQSTLSAYAYDQLVKTSTLPLTEVANTQNKSQLVLLPDGSQITLASHSRVSYARDLDKRANREVFLTGEAFFNVTKNPQHPFLVYAGGLVTRVVGTSFNVQTGDKQVSVVVRTGRVAVYPMKETDKSEKIDETSLLTPNQQATFLIDNQQITRTLANEPKVLSASEQEMVSFQFDNTPIAHVFTRLEMAYGVSIVYDKSVMKNCRLTVPMGEEPFFTKLDIICRTIGASYKVDGTQVVISSAGCDE